MTRPAPDYLDKITAVASQWLRRCNDKPAEGRPVSAHGLRVVLASSSNVRTKKDGTITWTAAAGQFSAEPVREQQAEGRP